jgi:hypothetical protein
VPVSFVKDLNEIGVLDGLTAEQIEQLDGAIIGLLSGRESSEARKDEANFRRRRERTIRRLNRIRKKIRREKEVIEELRDQVLEICRDDPQSSDINYPQALEAVVVKPCFLDPLKSATAALDSATLEEQRVAKQFDRPFEEILHVRFGEALQLHNFTDALMDFFEEECGLRKNAAESRTQRIGNYFFNWNISGLTRASGADQRKGSDAIRKRRSRAKRRDRTPSRKSR